MKVKFELVSLQLIFSSCVQNLKSLCCANSHNWVSINIRLESRCVTVQTNDSDAFRRGSRT